MEKNEEIISDEPNQYEINTGRIFEELTGVDTKKWKKYDREFLVNKVFEALESTLWDKNIISIKYNGKNGHLLEKYWDRQLFDLEVSDKPTHFPFPDYFLKPDKDSNYRSVVNYDESCIIKKEEEYFGLFFALQFSLADIVRSDTTEADEFLKYHFQNTFENNVSKFKYFLENLCIEYKEFLKEKYEPIAKRFIEKIEFNTQKEQENMDINGHSANRIKLKWLGSPSQFSYIFLQLAEKGFIELPSTSGQGSYSRYAKVCWDLFEFQNKTTQENLQKEMNPKKNTLSEGVQAKFTFPSLDEISKKQKK